MLAVHPKNMSAIMQSGGLPCSMKFSISFLNDGLREVEASMRWMKRW